MPRSDWVRMRKLAWLTQILYYGKFMQLPLLLVQALAKGNGDSEPLRHRELLEIFAEEPLPPNIQVLAYLRNLLHQKTQDMLAGRTEFIQGKEPSGTIATWLPTPIYVITELLSSKWLNLAYSESHALIDQLLRRRGLSLPPGLLAESMLLAQAIFQSSVPDFRFELTLSYNLWECYQQIITGQDVTLKPGRWRLTRSPEDTMGQLHIHEEKLEEAGRR